MYLIGLTDRYRITEVYTWQSKRGKKIRTIHLLLLLGSRTSLMRKENALQPMTGNMAGNAGGDDDRAWVIFTYLSK